MTATAQTDPDVKVPKGIKRAAARADAIHKQVYVQPPATAKIETQLEAAANADEPPAPLPTSDTTPPAPDPAPGSEPGPEEWKPVELSAEEWKHRFESVNGRYAKAEERIIALTSLITKMDGELSDLKRAATAPSPDRLKPAPRLLSDEEEADYGSEFLGVVGRRAQEIFSPEVSDLRDQVDNLTKQLQSVGENVLQGAKQKMFDSLDQGCPGWHKINTDPNFIAWLQLPDTYSGAIRHSLLKAAFGANDSPRVLAFFNGFLAEEAAVDPALGEPEQMQAATRAPYKVPLESLAAPGRAKTPAATHAPVEKPIIQRAQIAKFYVDVAQGRYRGKDAEKDRLERAIFEAERDGRIR